MATIHKDSGKKMQAVVPGSGETEEVINIIIVTARITGIRRETRLIPCVPVLITPIQVVEERTTGLAGDDFCCSLIISAL